MPEYKLDNERKDSKRHDRNTSIGGVMPIDGPIDGSTLGIGYKVMEVNLDDDYAEDEETWRGVDNIEVKPPQKGMSQDGKRRVSFGGVMSVESKAGGPVKIPIVHRAGDAKQNMDDEEVNNALLKQILPVGKINFRPDVQKMMEDLAKEHLNLKMSKIQLIMSTAREIDRLRAANKLLLNKLCQCQIELGKSTANGVQGSSDASGVLGVVTGLFFRSG